MERPLISICCITYNHEPYIRECLDGFLMQQTKFTIEILIHDDASTDGTSEVIREYQEKYPDVIFPVIQTENQYSKGVRGINIHYNFPRAKGKYIALCEGDDYWTDPLKLQKQVDVLESDSSIAICFHDANVKNELDSSFLDFYEALNKSIPNKVTTFENLIEANYLPTLSVLFRNINEPLPIGFFKFTVGDWPLHLLNSRFGNIYFLNEKMAVYRIHAGGVHRNGEGWNLKRKLIELRNEVSILNMLKDEVDKKHLLLIQKRKKGIYIYSLKLIIRTVFLRNLKIYKIAINFKKRIKL